jgi:hypothetical protein
MIKRLKDQKLTNKKHKARGSKREREKERERERKSERAFEWQNSTKMMIERKDSQGVDDRKKRRKK